MKTKLIAFVLCGIISAACSQKSEMNIIPQPQQVTVAEGCFVLDNNVTVTGNAEFEVEYLKGKLAKAAGIQTSENGKKKIEINVDPQSTSEKEGYTLTVTPNKRSITASDSPLRIKPWLT